MVNKKSVVKRAVQVGIISTLTLSIALSANAGDKSYKIDVANIPLNEALIQFTLQSEWQFLSPQKLLKGKKATAVKGMMSRGEALKQLLKGTGLDYIIDDKGQILIVPTGSKDISLINSKDKNIQLARASYISDVRTLASENRFTEESISAADEKEDEAEEYIEEVVTTGSNIRGTESASPVYKYDREDIEKTGLSTLPQFLRTIPQVFGGGGSEFTTNSLSLVNNASENFSQGTGINLRGLGTESTLILLDGRRMSAAGRGNFVDVSLLPLAAIERVEILPDGASATYGSDAVGGVVNFILRKDYEGAETNVRYGTATDGTTDEFQVGQVFGKNWNEGHAIFSYEYYKRTPLTADERSFTKDAPAPHTLLPQQERHSIFITVGQELTENVTFSGNSFYSERKGETFSGSAFSPDFTKQISKTRQYGVSLTTEIMMGETWSADFSGMYNTVKTYGLRVTSPLPVGSNGAASITRDENIDSETYSFDAKVDGALLDTYGGTVKVAFGGHFRRESFLNITGGELETDLDRKVTALFGEINIPLVSDKNSKAVLKALELNISGRYEDYSDFGSTTNYKIGLSYSPINSLKFRGTVGTSFRAPNLENLSEFNTLGVLLNIPAPMGGTSVAIIASGNNAGLSPETATIWTAGVDINPEFIPSLDIHFTYFNIDYKNRIRSSRAFFDALTNPDFAPLVTQNPDPEFVVFLLTNPLSRNFTLFPGFGPTADFGDATVLVDNRLRNLAREKTSGLDFIINYGLNTNVGAFNFTLNGTYMFEGRKQIFETVPFISSLNTFDNVIDLKIRGGLSWANNGFSSNLFVNYINSYKDVRQDPSVPVNSWTTLDLNLSYNTEDQYSSIWLNDTIFSLSVQNLFDQDPPLVAGAFSTNNLNFDAANASALGRFISFNIKKRW